MNKIDVVSSIAHPSMLVVAGGTGQHGVASGSTPDTVAEVSSVPPASDATGLIPSHEREAGRRSVVDDWRVALHEGGHVVVGRALGCEVAGVTIVPSGNYGGLTWGPMHVRSEFDCSAADEAVVPDLCVMIGSLMPGSGDSRSEVVDIFSHVHIRVVDLCAGTASETLLYPDDGPWIAHSDIRQARALASLVCSSESAIDAYLLFGLAEAKALIVQHRTAVLAIAEALMIERTLNSEQIDTIIASAPERARRADWAQTCSNASLFKPDCWG
jgi:hypothetical protein